MRGTTEPCNLKKCEPEGTLLPGRLFTCARPGRSLGRIADVPDEIAESWVDGLPKANIVHLVSLLGWKEDGRSEYSFYTFRGGSQNPDGRPTFQEWLDSRYCPDRFEVHDYPTEDAGDFSLSGEDIESLSTLVMYLLSMGETVVLFDSGGAQRTGQICRAIGFRRLPVKRLVVDPH
jgi:hypothetical protein